MDTIFGEKISPPFQGDLGLWTLGASDRCSWEMCHVTEFTRVFFFGPTNGGGEK